MEKEIFFLFNPDIPDTQLVKTVKVCSALPTPSSGKCLAKKAIAIKLPGSISKFLGVFWWN